jgi:hypothetical protein
MGIMKWIHVFLGTDCGDSDVVIVVHSFQMIVLDEFRVHGQGKYVMPLMVQSLQ